MAEPVREIMVDATPETIWPFLTEADQHVRWAGTEATINPTPGGTYRVLLGGGQHLAVGEYVEVVPMEKVVFTFGWEADDNPIRPGSTTVEISLHPEGDKTLVRLIHRGLPDDAVADHAHGWALYLDRLALGAAGGDPGPEPIPGASS